MQNMQMLHIYKYSHIIQFCPGWFWPCVVEHNFLSGKTLPNAEKFKYTQRNVGGYLTIAEAASVSYPNTVYMFNAQKCILGNGKSVNFCVIELIFLSTQ